MVWASDSKQFDACTQLMEGRNSNPHHHDYPRDKIYSSLSQRVSLSCDQYDDVKNSSSSSLVWMASLHPAVTVVPGHEFGISARITSCLATKSHRKVLMLSPIWGISLQKNEGELMKYKEKVGWNVSAAWDKSEWSCQSEPPSPSPNTS